MFRTHVIQIIVFYILIPVEIGFLFCYFINYHVYQRLIHEKENLLLKVLTQLTKTNKESSKILFRYLRSVHLDQRMKGN